MGKNINERKVSSSHGGEYDEDSFHRVVSFKQNDISEARTVSITRAMTDAVRTSDRLHDAIFQKAVIFRA
jgi:hypothetical protein